MIIVVSAAILMLACAVCYEVGKSDSDQHHAEIAKFVNSIARRNNNDDADNGTGE